MQLFKQSILIIILFNFLNLYCEISQNSQNDVKEIKESSKKDDSFFNRRKREKKIGAYLKKEFKELTFDELEFNKNLDLKNNKKEGAVNYLERMIAIWKPNPKQNETDKLCKLRLELADLYFDLELLEKAARNYKEFLKNYPGNENAEYVYYKLICCLFNQSGTSERDQAETKEACKLANEFLERETFVTYKDKVKKILALCNKKLLDVEINIFNYYLNRSVVKRNYLPAQQRLDYIKENFLNNPQTEEGKKLLFDLEEQLKAFKEKRRYVPQYLKDKEPFYRAFLPKRDKKKRPYGQRF